MPAIHGGKATTEKMDAHKIAVLRRGGRLPQADVSPAERRATRALLRRRRPLLRTRAALLAHRQQTHSPDPLPELHQKLAYQANRGGVAERFPAPAVPKSIAVDLTLIDASARRLTDLELALVQTAKAPAAQTFDRRRSRPGVGKILALVRLYDIHEIRRCPRGQACVSDGRLVQGAKASAGTRDGTSGKKMGHADRTGAVSAAAVLFWRNPPAGQKDLARRERTHGQGNAFTIVAHT
jgi:hypothetical protein